MKAVLLLVAFLGLTFGQEDCELLPALPANYQTTMQINVQHELRKGIRGVQGKADPPAKGQTYSFFEAVEGDQKAYMHYSAGTYLPK